MFNQDKKLEHKVNLYLAVVTVAGKLNAFGDKMRHVSGVPYYSGTQLSLHTIKQYTPFTCQDKLDGSKL